MTLRYTLIGSLVATGALLLPLGAHAQRYYSDVEVYRSPTVIYESPPPADTIATARPRLVVNHFVAVAERGVRNAPAANPTPRPNVTWSCQSAVA